MTDGQREQITAYATRLHMAREKVRALEMMNVPIDGESALKQTINYEIAKAEAQEASKAMDAARAKILST